MKKMNECSNSCHYICNFQDKDYYYILMEKCDGDLTDLLKIYNNGLPELLIENILLELNNAFKFMKNKNIIHRDLKPQNILIKYSYEDKKIFGLKISDYGLSKEYGHENFSSNAGTPGFMAPEQKKSDYDPSKCDLWALGVIIYMLKFVSLPYIDFYSGRIPKKFDNYKLNDLVHKLIVRDPTKRISWEDYFNHPLFE